jgi:hypothetical protein
MRMQSHTLPLHHASWWAAVYGECGVPELLTGRAATRRTSYGPQDLSDYRGGDEDQDAYRRCATGRIQRADVSLQV